MGQISEMQPAVEHEQSRLPRPVDAEMSDSNGERKRKAEEDAPRGKSREHKRSKSGVSEDENNVPSSGNGREASIAAQTPKQDTGDNSRVEGQRGSKQSAGDHKHKNKNKYKQRTFQHGSRGHKTKDMGRGEFFRQQQDRRKRHDEKQAKLQKLEEAGAERPRYMPEVFSKDEIAAEDRKPKRKVAVLLGYSGTGYKGMQISPTEKTIEGDLFAAFVKAGAISKVNADDPKKSSLVRCARTDKGVHAAGNIISLKLIIEDPDIVKKINEQLPAQIRIWGIERTSGSFSCYQACDSRWYEYLIPTHCFLPPHPSSYIGQHLEQDAEEEGDLESYHKRQHDVLSFWKEVEERDIKPILETLTENVRKVVEKALYNEVTSSKQLEEIQGQDDAEIDEENTNSPHHAAEALSADQDIDLGSITPNSGDDKIVSAEELKHTGTAEGVQEQATESQLPQDGDQVQPGSSAASDPEVASAIATLRAAYIKAKRAYRISSYRRERVAEALRMFVGTHNFHNFTIRKTARDPSARRHIKSFTVSEPIVINGSEWLSLKVHGQSFMMHQIRKMVGMASLIVRCGMPIERMRESMTLNTVNIPKAPALGLLLERPVFESYNAKAQSTLQREPIDFAKYEAQIEEFKRREIYDQMFRVEESNHVFHSFFAQIDNFREPTFLWVTSKGISDSAPRHIGTKSLTRAQKRQWAKNKKNRTEAGSAQSEDGMAPGSGAETEAEAGNEDASKREQDGDAKMEGVVEQQAFPGDTPAAKVEVA